MGRLVAYNDARSTSAARLWWLLHYLGHARLVILDGGWAAWLKAGFPFTADLPTPRPGQYPWFN